MAKAMRHITSGTVKLTEPWFRRTGYSNMQITRNKCVILAALHKLQSTPAEPSCLVEIREDRVKEPVAGVSARLDFKTADERNECFTFFFREFFAEGGHALFT